MGVDGHDIDEAGGLPEVSQPCLPMLGVDGPDIDEAEGLSEVSAMVSDEVSLHACLGFFSLG